MFGLRRNRPLPGGCRYYSSREDLPETLQARLADLAYQWGETYDAYLVNEGRREYFWLPEHEGVISFTRWGRHGHVVGGILAPPQKRSQLLRHALAFAKERRLSLSFYNIGRDQLKLFQEQGCRVSKCGEEPIIALDQTEWRGKPYEWVRRQENYCRRQGIDVEEINPDPSDANYRKIIPELEQVSRAHIQETLHGRELKFFVGSFDPHQLLQRRLFVARDQDQRILAFVVCNPCLAGEMWAVEIYRKLPAAPRGIIPFTMMQALRALKEEGVAYASLSLIPLLRCDPKLQKESWLFCSIANFWWKHLNWIFDVQGMYHFKSRFRPEYREMFMAAYPKATLGSIVAMGMIWEIILFNPLRLLRRRSKGGDDRQTIAKPAWRPERVLRSLKPKKADPILSESAAVAASLVDPSAPAVSPPAESEILTVESQPLQVP